MLNLIVWVWDMCESQWRTQVNLFYSPQGEPVLHANERVAVHFNTFDVKNLVIWEILESNTSLDHACTPISMCELCSRALDGSVEQLGEYDLFPKG